MLIRLAMIISLALVAACGQESAEAPASTSTSAAPAVPVGPRPAPPGAVAYIIEPTNGAVVPSPVHVVFGLRGAGIAPAGVVKENTGHHHLLIDTGLPNLELAIPNDDTHRHFGGGQTEADIELAPGQHTLQLLLGDERHIPHDPPIASERITITVR